MRVGIKVSLVLLITVALLLCTSFASAEKATIVGTEKKKSWIHSLASRLFNFASFSSTNELVTRKMSQDSENKGIIDVKSNEYEVQQLMAEALALIDADHIDSAVDKLISVLQKDPSHQQANACMGAILLGLGQYETAEPMLITAVTVANWTDVSATINLAKLLQKQNKNDLALKSLFQTYNATKISLGNRESTSVDSKFVVDPFLRLQLSLEIADIMLAMENFTQAADWSLSTAIRFANFAAQSSQANQPLEFNLTQVWIQASTLYFPDTFQDMKRAENVFIQGVQMHPKDADLVYNLGLVLYMTGRVEQAMVFYEEALRLTQNRHVDTLAAYATALHSLKRLNDAERLYVLALQYQPEHVVLLSNYARLLYALGGTRINEAVQVLQRAYDLDPSHREVINAMQAMGARVVPNVTPDVTGTNAVPRPAA